MPTPKEILSLVENALKQTEGDRSALECWRQTEDGQKVIQYIQIGKYNTVIGEGKNITIGDQLDRSLLEEIRDLLLKQVPSPPLDINWQEVSHRRLSEQRLQLTTNPMTRGEDVDYQVEHVFVPLGLVERKKIPRRKRDVLPERGSELYQEGGNEGTDADLAEEIEVTQRFEHEEFLEQVLRQRKSPKSQGSRIAIIGEPGAGKTTLLQQIAGWICTTFPESIVIWVSLADLQGNTIEYYLEKIWLKSIIREAGGAENSVADERNFADQFQRGQVWLLLDGLDEMQSPANSLSEIQRQIQEGGWVRQARLILTCRLNLWDGNYNTLAGFDTYRTLDFSYPAQVEQFIQQWFAPRKKKDLGQALCSALTEPGKERIRDLVKNPLRLTLLCFSWYLQQGRLPETQAELYQRSIDRFYEWKQEQFPTTSMQRASLNQALAELSRQAIDDTDDRQQTRFRLRYDFIRHHLDKPLLDGQKTLLDLALEIGWLNQVGVDADDPEQRVYAFFHPTFEEYFAALSISDEKFFFNPIPKKPMGKEAIYRIFEPQWRQVFLLWLGRKDEMLRPQKEALIKSLLTFRDRCGGFYSDRAFLLAAIGISEFRDCSFSNQIVKQLLHWKFGNFNFLVRNWLLLINPGRVTVRRKYAEGVFKNTDSQKMIQALISLLRKMESTLTHSSKTIIQKVIQICRQELNFNRNLYMYHEVAESLGKLSPDKENAILAIKCLLENTGERKSRIRGIRTEAVKSLEVIGENNKNAIETLESILKTTRDYDTVKNVSESLGKISSGDETAIQSLAWLLEVTKDKPILALTKSWYETAIQSLRRFLEVLEITQNKSTFIDRPWNKSLTRHIRLIAAQSLGKIGTGNETAIAELLQILRNSQDKEIHFQAFDSLSKIALGNETVIRALINLIDETHDENICLRAIFTLNQIGTGNEMAIRSLVQFMKMTEDENFPSRSWYVADSLGKIGTHNEIAIQSLLQLIKEVQDENIRWYAAKALGKIDPGNETAIKTLVQIVETTEYDYNYLGAAYGLGKIDPGNEIAIQSLVWLVETLENKNENESLQTIAACNLSEIASGNETAIRALVDVLERTQDEHNRWLAVKGLYKAGSNYEDLIYPLVQIVERTKLKDTQIKTPAYKEAVDMLSSIGIGNETAIQEFARMLRTKKNYDIYRRALENLENIGIGNEAAIHAILQFLIKVPSGTSLSELAIDTLNKIIIRGENVNSALLQFIKHYNESIKANLDVREVYEVMMTSADILSYKDFWQAFNSSPSMLWMFGRSSHFLDNLWKGRFDL
ncbi:MAG: NACHT domain-containing protein [Leptolyngbyaceae cyanobacterium CSU_1_3]|nr:NACHT domain-containing protein [Leptolyngbyaceae cyanobacterium CSU_1_3]